MQYHIGLDENKIMAKYAIVPGDPGRVEKIAALLDKPKFVAQNREFTTWSGFIDREKVLVVSTGIGGASASIAIEELINCGIDTVIRVGTCGGMQLHVKGGDAVVAMAAVRMEGTSREYMPIEYPAAADFETLCALKSACDQNGITSHVGVVQSKDSFYGQHSPESMPVRDTLQKNWQAYIDCGCLASEMETAAIFTVASVRRIRAGSILHVLWNQERKKAGLEDTEVMDTSKAISAAVQAIKILIKKDMQNER